MGADMVCCVRNLVALISEVATTYMQSVKCLVTFIVCCIFQALLYPNIPLLHRFQNRYVLWCFLIVLLIAIRFFAALGFTCINVLINNSVEKELLGSANGFAMTVASIGRTVSGTLFGSSFSWSLTNIEGVKDNKSPLGFPFNHYFIFFLLSTFSIISCVMTFRVPKTLNKKR